MFKGVLKSYTASFNRSQAELPFEERVQTWVAYATNMDPINHEFNSTVNVEIRVALTTAPGFPGAIHEGVQRSPLYPAAHYHKGAAITLHEVGQRVLRDLYPAQPCRYLFVRPLKLMLTLMEKAVKPHSLCLGRRETLGVLGMPDMDSLSEEDREIFHKNREFLTTSLYAEKYAPPVISYNRKSEVVLIYDWESPERIIFDINPAIKQVISETTKTPSP